MSSSQDVLRFVPCCSYMCHCWCNSIETAVPWSEWYWTTQCRSPAGTWIVRQETVAQAIPQREPWPREDVVCSAYPYPFAITLAASGGCSYSLDRKSTRLNSS